VQLVNPLAKIRQNDSPCGLFSCERILILFNTTLLNSMKKIIALVLVAGFLASCSQYTCPTYAKKEAPKKVAQKRI
jgi:hypothetical protein